MPNASPMSQLMVTILVLLPAFSDCSSIAMEAAANPAAASCGLLRHQIVDRNLLRDRPLVDHLRLALLGIDDQIASLVLMVQLLAEGARTEQGGLVVHLLELGDHGIGLRRLVPLDRLGPDVDQDIAGIDILAGRIAAGDLLVLLVE